MDYKQMWDRLTQEMVYFGRKKTRIDGNVVLNIMGAILEMEELREQLLQLVSIDTQIQKEIEESSK